MTETQTKRNMEVRFEVLTAMSMKILGYEAMSICKHEL
jgi:hypothetical protein